MSTDSEALNAAHLDHKPSKLTVIWKRMWQLRMGVFGFVLVIGLVMAAVFERRLSPPPF